MKVQKFEARDLPAAISKVKEQLGNDAVILHTRKRKKGGLLGLFGRQMVEVTAAPGQNQEKRAPAAGYPGSASSPPVPPQPPQSLHRLEGELQELKSMVAGLQGPATGEQPHDAASESELFRAYSLLNSFHQLLVDNEVQPDYAASLLREVISQLDDEGLQDYGTVRETLLNLIVRDLGEPRQLGPDHRGRRAVAIIGPTGVGKTTTVAKLAARYALIEQNDVAVITADTYRIGAVEQLRRYTEIINVPLEVVMSPAELGQAMERHRQKQVLLLDTAGRSQRNTVQISEVKDLLNGSDQLETILAVSLTTKHRDLMDVVEKFALISYDALLLTKVDESNSFGNVYNLARRLQKPMTFVTNGQNVPDDIEVARPEKMAKLIMGEKPQ